MNVWAKGLIAAVISGAAGGVVNCLAAIGIAPNAFNLQPGIGFHHTLYLAAISSVLCAILGIAMYLQKSPLP